MAKVIMSDTVGHDEKLDDFSCQPLNSLHIDVANAVEGDATELARNLCLNGLRQLRRESRQFWIGQDFGYLDDFLKLSVKSNWNNAEPYGPTLHTLVFTPSRRTIAIDYNIWSHVWRTIFDEQRIDWLDYALDCEHLIYAKQFEKALMQLCISIELMKYELWGKLKLQGRCERKHEREASGDTSKPYRYFGEILKQVVNRDLSSELPETSEMVNHAWIGRGLIAHGKSLQNHHLFPVGLNADLMRSLYDRIYDLRHFIDSVLENN